MANPVKPIVASDTPPATTPVVDDRGIATPTWFRSFQNASGYIAYQASWQNITPAGTTQATAPEISTRNVYLLTASAAGVRLPRLPFQTQRVLIINGSGSAQDIYPGVGGNIDAAGLNVPVSLANGAKQEFIAGASTQWISL